ncbi:phosphoribosyltransferase-like protein [Pavlovales sp. CCMP2436]|nr:phosphoribosyltransferase-like protein [Pavlovales sp. CCMP2436]
MDHIIVGGFSPVNRVMRSHVLFLADFNSNDAILSQLHVLVMLCESFIATLTIHLPYLPTATMERITVEGEVATANTVCRILSGLPHTGGPSRVMFYDLHTLQNRFYLHTGAIATMHTTVPLIKEVLARAGSPIDAIAFPDEGAQKRFGDLFSDEYDIVTCGKKRVGDERKVVIQDGDCAGKHLLIVDDMVKTGGTLVECAKALLSHGAIAVSAFCAHAAFPPGVENRFCQGGDRHVFQTFYVSNSNTIVIERILQLPASETAFEVLDILPLVLADL